MRGQDATLPLAGADLRNMLTLPSGELAGRPGLRKVYSPESGRLVCGGFSVRNHRTGDVWHYVVDVDDDDDDEPVVRVYDEDYTLLQSFDTGAGPRPVAVSHAIADGKLLISSPSFAPLFAYVGDGLRWAEKVASVNPGTTAIDIPRGIAVAWADRSVIAAGGILYISDALEPRTYVAQNATPGRWGGPVWGVHVTTEGALVAVTSSGVWALPEEAAAGQIVIGQWVKLTDHQSSSYGSSCAVRGDVWVASQQGLRRVHPPAESDVLLSERHMPRALAEHISRPDYRAGRVFAWERGPLLSLGNALHVTDLATGVASWWTAADIDELEVVGVLEEQDGTDVLLLPDGGYRVEGNFDGDAGLDEESETTPIAVAAMRLASAPGLSPTLRALQVASDTGGQVRFGVHGNTKTKQGAVGGAVIGTGEWGTATYQAPVLRSKRTTWAKATDDLSVEVGVDGCLTRIGPEVTATTTGQGRRRP